MKRVSWVGMTVAVLWLVMCTIPMVVEEFFLAMAPLPGIALMVRSFWPPLDWKRGLATLLGGLFTGAALDRVVVGTGLSSPDQIFITAFVLFFGGALLWEGFKRPKVGRGRGSAVLADDAGPEVAETPAESEPDGQGVPEASLEAGALPSEGIRRGRIRRFLPVAGACLLVAILGSVGWSLRDDIRSLLFLAMECDRIEDTVDGYARYRHVESGSVIVDLEGTLFQALGPNPQDCPEYRHWQSGLVFVRLPGGTVEYGGRWGRTREGRSEGTVGPYLIAKRPLIGPPLEDAFLVALGRPFSAFVSDEGRYNYGVMFDFAERLGVSGWSPTVEQRLFALGSDWQPEAGTTVQRASPDAPNEYGIVGLRHDPNIEPGFRLVHDLTSSRPPGTGVVSTGLEGITEAPSRELGSVVDRTSVIRIVEQQWSGVAAGSIVYTEEGEPVQIRNDLASLGFAVSVENSSGTVLLIRLPANLVGSGGQVVAPTHLEGVRTQTRELPSDDPVEVEPGQTVILEFVSRLEELDDLEAAEPLYIEFEHHGWRMEVDPLPPRQELYD